MISNIKVILFIILYVSILDVNHGQNLYEISWKKDLPIYLTSTALGIGSEIIERSKDPITEEFIANLNKNNIPAFDRNATLNYSSNYGNYSDLCKNLVYIVPFSMMGSKRARHNFKEIFTMYTEVLVLNGSITYFSKSIVNRVRPYAYNPEVPLDVKLNRTTRRSFFSGHTSHVSSMSFFTARMFSDFYPDSKYKYLVWGGAVVIPALTGYLRYKAGSHFPSDIIIGFGIGAAVGLLIPKIHKIKIKESKATLSITGNRIGLNYSFN